MTEDFFVPVIFLGLRIDSRTICSGFYIWQPFFLLVIVKIPFAVDDEPVSNDGGFSSRVFFLDLLNGVSHVFAVI